MTIKHANTMTGIDNPIYQTSKDEWNADHVLSDGTSSAPSLAFASETTLGLWRIGSQNAGLSGSLAIKGPRPWADAMAYGTGSLTATEVQAAINAIALTGGVVLVTGAVALGTTSLTIDNDGIELRGVGHDAGAATAVGTTFSYTGTGTAIAVGSGGADRWYCSLKDLKVVGSASGAIGIDMNRTFHGVIDNVLVRDFTTGTGIQLHGTNSFGAYNLLLAPRTSNCLKGLYVLGVDGGTEFGSNANTVVGGSLNGGNIASSICAHYAGGTIKEIGGTEHTNATTGVKLSGTSTHVLNAPRFEGTTTAILIDSDVIAPFIEGPTFGSGITTIFTNNGKGLVYIPAEGDRQEIRQSRLAVPASRTFSFIEYQNESAQVLWKVDSSGKAWTINPLDASADFYIQAGSTAEQSRSIHYVNRAGSNVWDMSVTVQGATTGWTLVQTAVRTWINANANNGFLTFSAGSGVTFPDGTVGTNGISFTNDTDCGLYRIGTNNWALAANGTKMIELNATQIGFFAVGPATRASAITQTYATATRTHSNDTASDMVTTASTQTTPWGFASQAQADAIATKFNALRVDVDNLKQVVNSVIDDLQAYGLEA